MIHFKLVEYLTDQNNFCAGSRIMDVGAQNFMHLEENKAVEFVESLRHAPLSERDIEGIRKVRYFSPPRPNERSVFLPELLAFTDVEYDSVDIVDGLKTTIFRKGGNDDWRSAFSPDHQKSINEGIPVVLRNRSPLAGIG
jgi:hypothetical protein